MRLLFGPKLAEWALARIPEMQGSGFGPCQCIGFADENDPLAVAVFHGYREQDGDIQVSFAAASPKWATRGNFRAVFFYPFVQIGCRRLTAFTPKRNRAARRLLEGTGFILEGTLRQALWGRENVCVYGMLKEECRWLRGIKDEQETTSRAAAA